MAACVNFSFFNFELSFSDFIPDSSLSPSESLPHILKGSDHNFTMFFQIKLVNMGGRGVKPR